MTLDEIIIGLYPMTTPSFPGLVIRQPSRADFRAIQPGLVHYSPVSILTKLDVEKELPDDYYRVREMASKKRDEIILQLSEAETPDERFVKTQEEIKAMSPEEQNAYLEYRLQQYSAMNQRLEAEPIIRQFGGYEEMRLRLKESQEEKLQYDKESKELISNISHDLKTPITAIKGYVEGIQDGVASSPEKLDKYIRTIYNKANDMDRLIDELTFYSKIDTNKIPYNFSKINVAEYFGDCVEEVGLDMETRGN